MTPAAAAIQAAKNLHKWGKDAARRFAFNRGASLRMVEIAERVECNRRIRATLGGWLA